MKKLVILVLMLAMIPIATAITMDSAVIEGEKIGSRVRGDFKYAFLEVLPEQGQTSTGTYEHEITVRNKFSVPLFFYVNAHYNESISNFVLQHKGNITRTLISNETNWGRRKHYFSPVGVYLLPNETTLYDIAYTPQSDEGKWFIRIWANTVDDWSCITRNDCVLSNSIDPSWNRGVNNITSYYPLDDDTTSGSTTVDLVKNHNGTITGATTGGAGKINESYEFDGTDDEINFGTSSDFDFDNTLNRSVAFWVRRTVDSQANLLGKWSNTDKNWRVRVQSNGGTVRASVGNGANSASKNLDTTSQLSTSTFALIVMTYNSSSTVLSVYFNDTLENSDTVTNIGLSAEPFVVSEMTTSPERDFEGFIDEIGFWDRTLSASDVVLLYNNGTGCQYNFSEAGCLSPPPPPSPSVVINITTQINSSLNETEFGNYTINFSFPDSISNVTGANLTLDDIKYQSNVSEFGLSLGANWSYFEYTGIVTPLIEINHTNVTLNWTYLVTLANTTITLNITNNSNMTIDHAYVPRTVHFVSPIAEGSDQNMTVNITKIVGFRNGVAFDADVELNQTNISTFLEVNNTDYEDRTTAQFNAPMLTATTALPLRGLMTVSFQNKSFIRNTANFSQTVQSINITGGNPGCQDLSINLTAVLNFTFHDEFTNDTIDINGSSQITIWSDNQTVNDTFGFDYAGVTFHEICIQEPINFTADYFLQYSNLSGSPIYPIREFHKRQQAIDNITEQYHLYSLIEPNATEIIFNVRDEIDNRLINIIVEAHKYNISNDSFKIVDTGLTDINGQTRLRLHQADDFFKFVLRNGTNGVILETTRFKLLFLEYFFRPKIPGFIGLIDIIAFRKIDQTLTYNNGTGIIRLTYNDLANASGMNANCLEVINTTNFNYTLISDQCSQNQSGTFTFSLLGSNGTYLGMYVIGEGSVLVNTISIIRRAFRELGQDGMFLAFILIGTMAFAGMLITPTVGILFAVMGVIGTVWLGLIDIGWAPLVAMVIAGVMIGLFINKQN